MSAWETIEQDGFTAELHYEEDPASPAEWDQLGTLVGFGELTRNYGFAQASTGEDDDMLERRGTTGLVRLYALRGMVAVPFHFADYGSGGARLYATDETDENPSGFIFTTHERVSELASEKPEYHTTEWIRDALVGELNDWGRYVEGDVHGIVVKDPAGEVVESVWGFYGFEYAKSEAVDMLSAVVEQAKLDAAAEQVERDRAARMDVATTTTGTAKG